MPPRLKPEDRKVCSDCGDRAYARELCRYHYMADWQKRTEAPLVHGLYSSYISRGCRCSECREARTQYERDRRARERGEA